MSNSTWGYCNAKTWAYHKSKIWGHRSSMTWSYHRSKIWGHRSSMTWGYYRSKIWGHSSYMTWGYCNTTIWFVCIVLQSVSVCIRLFQVTDNAAAAAATVAAAENLAEEQRALANFAPVITNSNVTIQVSGSSFIADLLAAYLPIIHHVIIIITISSWSPCRRRRRRLRYFTDPNVGLASLLFVP